jgi:hypothetical protein
VERVVCLAHVKLQTITRTKKGFSMAERMVDPEANAPEEDIDDVLKTVIRAVLDEAATKMEAGEEVIPFTGLAVKENLFIETHPGDDVEECFLAARREVEGARGATAYA